MPWLIAALACLAVVLLLAPLRRWLKMRGILDLPNARSSHTTPLPRGAGLVVVPVAVVAWGLLGGFHRAEVLVALLALLLGAITWLDDLRGLTVLSRLAVQAVAVFGAIFVLPPDALVFQGWLPLVLDRAVAALLWLWFVNLFNFMDGIDGLTGAATTIIAGGAALVLWMGNHAGEPMSQALALAGAAIGFLAWNWPPARIFLGDVGSIGLGFLVGWLLLRLAIEGFWAAALLLPLYHFADATLTLALRLARGDRVWLASRAHFYQRGVAAFSGHAPVLLRILAAKLVLVALAVLATAQQEFTLPALVAGGLIVVVTLWHFATAARRVGDAA